MVSANREMAVYCFDTLVAHYNSEQAPPPAFDEGQHPLFVTWKKAVNGGWTKMETIDSLMRKAAYNGAITESLRKRVRLTRYQSTLYTMHYSDYASYVKRTRGTVPAVASAKPNH